MPPVAGANDILALSDNSIINTPALAVLVILAI
jgi:hypothetical protein